MFVRMFAMAAAVASLCSPAFAQSTPDWSKAQTVTISLSNYAFTPAAITLKANQPYDLVFQSTVNKDHNFASKDLFASGIVASQDKAKVSSDGEVEVDDGGTVSVHFMPQKPGTYPVECTHFMHAMMGMKGTVTVE